MFGMNIHLPSSNVTIFGDHFRLIVSPAIVNSKNRMTIPLHFLAGWNEVYYTIFTCIYIYHIYLYIYIYVCVSIYKYIECTWIQFPMWFGKCFYIVFFKSISRRIESEWILVQCFFHLPWIEHILYVYYWNILCLCFFNSWRCSEMTNMFKPIFYVLVYITFICTIFIPDYTSYFGSHQGIISG